MSLRGLLVLINVVLLAGSVAALVWLTRAPSEPAVATAVPLLRSFTTDSVREIALRCDAGTVTLRQDAPSSWRLVQPIEAEADPRRVSELIAALQDAKARKTIAESATDLASFGLAPPACDVSVLRGADSKVVARLGRASPVGAERYASVDGAKVVLTDGSLYDAATRGPEAFREKRLIPVEADDMAAIALTRPEDRLALVLENGGCRLESPYPDTASTSACTSLARAVASLSLKGPFEAAPPQDARANHLVRIEVTAKGKPSPIVAFVAAAGVAGSRVAWRDGATLIGLLDDAAAADLSRSAESFRDRRILTFSAADVRRLTVWRHGEILSVERTGASAPWTDSAGGTIAVDGARVDALLDTLRDLNAAGFVPTRPEGDAMARVMVALFGTRGEFARLTFGPLARPDGPGADQVWLTSSARPSAVFRLDAATLAGVPQSASDLAPRAQR